MNQPSKVVITGAGAVCGAGLKVHEIWEAVTAGRSAVKRITSWDTESWPGNLGAEVAGVDNRTLVEDRKLHKLITRTDMFGLYAAGTAVQASGVLAYRDTLGPEETARFNDRSGIFAGSGGGNYRSNYEFFPLLTAAKEDLRKFGRELGENVNPMWLLRVLPNNVVCHAGIRHGFKGTNACITNQAVGGALALLEAAESLRAGEADRALAVGHDSPLEPETVLHFHRLGLTSHEAPRPFDAGRAGTILGEGAGAVLLEQEPHATARGATILGEFLGAACANESAGILAVRPDGDGLARAILGALANAGLKPADVGMVVAHANGTRASDASEVQALRRVFGEAIPPVTGFKWALGHLIAASGMVDVILALEALRRRTVPGIATLNSLDPAFADFPASRSPQIPGSDVALVLSRGFGSLNVAVLVRGAPAPPSI